MQSQFCQRAVSLPDGNLLSTERYGVFVQVDYRGVGSLLGGVQVAVRCHLRFTATSEVQ